MINNKKEIVITFIVTTIFITLAKFIGYKSALIIYFYCIAIYLMFIN